LKIKLFIDFIIIIILSTILVLDIIVSPNTFVRIVFGLPFLLFYPGYIILAVLFPTSEIDNIERIALSFGISIPVVCLMGLGLNFTPWGITLRSTIYSISSFIVILLVIAIIRRWYYYRKKITSKLNWRMSNLFQGSILNKTLSVILIVAILGVFGTLVYNVTKPKDSDKFTELFILGISGKAEDYPSDFVLNSNLEVVSVKYGNETTEVSENWGQLTLGIINHEKQDTSYTVKMQIDGTQVGILYQGGIVDTLGPIVLIPEEKWQQEIDIMPEHSGDNQKIELFLYKDGEAQPYLNVHLWINVTQQ